MYYNLYMYSAIILSAGQSTRFGSPKALATINNTTSIEHIQHKLLISNIAEIIVVLGHNHEVIIPHLLPDAKVRMIYNAEHLKGQFSSIQCGMRECSDNTDGALIWPIDCPWIQSATAVELIRTSNGNTIDILIPTYQGKNGHPPLIPRSLFEKILRSPLDSRLNHFIKKMPHSHIEINDPGIIKSFNTPEELKEFSS